MTYERIQEPQHISEILPKVPIVQKGVQFTSITEAYLKAKDDDLGQLALEALQRIADEEAEEVIMRAVGVEAGDLIWQWDPDEHDESGGYWARVSTVSSAHVKNEAVLNDSIEFDCAIWQLDGGAVYKCVPFTEYVKVLKRGQVPSQPPDKKKMRIVRINDVG